MRSKCSFDTLEEAEHKATRLAARFRQTQCVARIDGQFKVFREPEDQSQTVLLLAFPDRTTIGGIRPMTVAILNTVNEQL